MSDELDIMALRSRIAEVEDRLDCVYKHPRIEYVASPQGAELKVVEALKAGKKSKR